MSDLLIFEVLSPFQKITSLKNNKLGFHKLEGKKGILAIFLLARYTDFLTMGGFM